VIKCQFAYYNKLLSSTAVNITWRQHIYVDMIVADVGSRQRLWSSPVSTCRAVNAAVGERAFSWLLHASGLDKTLTGYLYWLWRRGWSCFSCSAAFYRVL